MPVGRYFQALSSYDLLGNLVPGVVGLLAILGFTSNPPLFSSVSGIALYAAGAFVLGSVIQAYASRAVGKPRSFIRTISTTEKLPSLEETTGPGDEELDEVDFDEIEEGDSDYLDIKDYSTIKSILHAFLGPIFWWCFDRRGQKLDDAILANRIWNHLTKTHKLETNTTKFGVLYHLMTSKLDNAQAPSRALRMQAIRNFNRGMWITAWGSSILILFSIILDACFDPGENILDPIKYTRPAYFDYWTPIGSLLILTSLAVLIFWVLYRSSEEDYIEYLFTDYAVSIAEGGTEVLISDQTDPLPIGVAHLNELEKEEDGESSSSSPDP